MAGSGRGLRLFEPADCFWRVDGVSADERDTRIMLCGIIAVAVFWE